MPKWLPIYTNQGLCPVLPPGSNSSLYHGLSPPPGWVSTCWTLIWEWCPCEGHHVQAPRRGLRFCSRARCGLAGLARNRALRQACRFLGLSARVLDVECPIPDELSTHIRTNVSLILQIALTSKLFTVFHSTFIGEVLSRPPKNEGL